MKECNVLEIQRLCALLGALDIVRFQLDADTAGLRANGDEQRNMAQSGAEIDQNIGCCERSEADETEDVARRGRLIRHYLGFSSSVSGERVFELKDFADQFIEIVIAHAVGLRDCFFGFRWRMDPTKQGIGSDSALNFFSKGSVERMIHGFEPEANFSRSAVELRLD